MLGNVRLSLIGSSIKIWYLKQSNVQSVEDEISIDMDKVPQAKKDTFVVTKPVLARLLSSITPTKGI